MGKKEAALEKTENLGVEKQCTLSSRPQQQGLTVV
jgi:hypothetical protein